MSVGLVRSFQKMCLQRIGASKVTYVLVGLLLTTNAWSANVWFTGAVKKVYPHADGKVVLSFESQNAGCPNTVGYHRIQVGQNGVTQEGMDHMLSTLLTAAASNRDVTIVFDDSDNYCYINRLQTSFHND